MFKKKTKEGVMEETSDYYKNFEDLSVQDLLERYAYYRCDIAKKKVIEVLIKRVGMAEEYRERAITAENKLKELKKAFEVIQSIKITDRQ